ncbi:MAG: bifunctional acetate--CoA ligase family protein/GNAT family N-acetyltransferase [Xanthobacteraceae bacterium]
MSTYRLDKLFAPRSVAVMGASPRESSLGRAIIRNLRSASFPGPIHLVNPFYAEIDGITSVKSIRAIPAAPDLVVITVPSAMVPDAVQQAAEKGAAGAIVITAGLGHGPGSLADAAERAARAHGLRLIGPNCLGVMVPGQKLNASFAMSMAHPGDLALIAQSGAIAAGMVEWAAQRNIGFSAVVSIGDQIDVDFGDLLDYFAVDRQTRAILLYVESINHARKFMSAARAAARTKPVVVVKAGRHAQGARAAATHTGALAGSDAVYDAAFRRAGLLRVLDFGELFDAAETLGRQRPFPGKRLAILTNGGGVAVLAVDRLIDLGGGVAELSADTSARLDEALPASWSKGNPVDIAGDADAARYAVALEALLADPANDAVLALNVPTALASPSTTAQAVADVVQRKASLRRKPVFAVWIGADEGVARTFAAAAIPHFATEASAVLGFMHLVRYSEGRDALMETPPNLPEHFVPDVTAARTIVAAVLREGRTWLDPIEVTRLCEAYEIPIVPTVLARGPEEAERVAARFLRDGGAVVVKIQSRDIVHKSDVGGVRLNLTSAQAVRDAAAEVIARARAAKPDARIAGVTIQPMIVRPKARELIAGIAADPTFGPVIVFGRGGTAVEIINDKALALPPLDLKLAKDLIARTRVSRILEAYRDVPAVKSPDVPIVLVKLAQLAADLPEVLELDINPLLADETGVMALDARVAVAPVEQKFLGSGNPRLAIRPYPKEWERELALGNGTLIGVRPVRPEDEPMFHEFFERVTAEDLRLRFFAPVKEFSHTFIARLTQIDYARAMALAAIDKATGDLLGVVRLHADANYAAGEYAILLRSDLKGQGLGWQLMQLIIEYARSEGLQRIEGQVLRENTAMLEMCGQLGFDIKSDPHEIGIVVVTLPLGPTS